MWQKIGIFEEVEADEVYPYEACDDFGGELDGSYRTVEIVGSDKWLIERWLDDASGWGKVCKLVSYEVAEGLSSSLSEGYRVTFDYKDREPYLEKKYE